MFAHSGLQQPVHEQFEELQAESNMKLLWKPAEMILYQEVMCAVGDCLLDIEIISLCKYTLWVFIVL